MPACHGIDEMLGSIAADRRTARRHPCPAPCGLHGTSDRRERCCRYIGDSDGDYAPARRAGLECASASWAAADGVGLGSDATLSRFSEVAET
jgi:hypothetical protein